MDFNFVQTWVIFETQSYNHNEEISNSTFGMP